MQVEINRVTHLYKANRISGTKGHEMLHLASKDINTLFWQVSTMISQEHGKINFLHKVKKSIEEDPESEVNFSDMEVRKVAGELPSKILPSERSKNLFEQFLESYYHKKPETPKIGKRAIRQIRADSRSMCIDIRNLLRKFKP